MREWAYSIVSAAAVAAIVILLFILPVDAHSWYDPSCCSTLDCAPVPDGIIEERSDGIHVKGYGILSYEDPRVHWSQDDQDHTCENSTKTKLLCIYRKPKGM